jgi:peptide deformylase
LKYRVLTYGHSELRRKAKPVRTFDIGLRTLASDLIETMHASSGVGLAAEQIGRNEAVCVIHVPAAQDRNTETGERENPDIAMPVVLVNPKIMETEGTQSDREGCLSFPEIYVTIRRVYRIACSFQDLDGKTQTIRVVGLAARAVQHEVDHLNGVLLVDRMSTVQKLAFAGRLKRLKSDAKAETEAG